MVSYSSAGREWRVNLNGSVSSGRDKNTNSHHGIKYKSELKFI